MRTGDQGVGLRICDMQRAIRLARQAIAGLDFDEFRQQPIPLLAAERTLEIISEASRHIPEDLKASAPEIPWRKIAGIGNVLRHDYREVSIAVVWNTIRFDLGKLEVVLLAFSQQFPPPQDD